MYKLKEWMTHYKRITRTYMRSTFSDVGHLEAWGEGERKLQPLRRARVDWSFSGLFTFPPTPPPPPHLLSRLSPNLIGLSVAAAVFSNVVQHRPRWWQAVNFLFDSCSRCLCVRLWSGLPGSGTSGGKHYSPTAGRPSKHPQRCPSHEERRNTGDQKKASKHGILGLVGRRIKGFDQMHLRFSKHPNLTASLWWKQKIGQLGFSLTKIMAIKDQETAGLKVGLARRALMRA